MLKHIEQEIDRQIVEILLGMVLKPNKLTTIPIVSYGELADEIGKRFDVPKPHPRSFSTPLDRIQQACSEYDLPPLATLVVYKKKRLPGDGYKTAYDEHYGTSGEDASVTEIFYKELSAIQQLVGSSAWMPLIQHYGLENAFPNYTDEQE